MGIFWCLLETMWNHAENENAPNGLNFSVFARGRRPRLWIYHLDLTDQELINGINLWRWNTPPKELPPGVGTGWTSVGTTERTMHWIMLRLDREEVMVDLSFLSHCGRAWLRLCFVSSPSYLAALAGLSKPPCHSKPPSKAALTGVKDCQQGCLGWANLPHLPLLLYKKIKKDKVEFKISQEELVWWRPGGTKCWLKSFLVSCWQLYLRSMYTTYYFGNILHIY